MIPLRDANPTLRTPVVTLAIIVACFVDLRHRAGVQATSGEAGLTELFDTFGRRPATTWSRRFARAISSSLPVASLITSQFLHGGWLHLLGQHALPVDLREQRRGPPRPPGFLVFYLAGGVIAGPRPGCDRSRARTSRWSARPARSPPSSAPTSCSFRGRGSCRSCSWAFFYQLIEVPAVIVLGFWFVLQLIDGLASLGADGAEGGVAFFAHIGGFVFGVLVGLLAWVATATAGRRLRAGRPPADGRGIIRPWTTACRDGRRERPRPHALEPARRDPQGDRPRALPADLDRAVGGQRDRDEAPGPDARAPADPRPVRDDARGARRARSTGW